MKERQENNDPDLFDDTDADDDGTTRGERRRIKRARSSNDEHGGDDSNNSDEKFHEHSVVADPVPTAGGGSTEQTSSGGDNRSRHVASSESAVTSPARATGGGAAETKCIGHDDPGGFDELGGAGTPMREGGVDDNDEYDDEDEGVDLLTHLQRIMGDRRARGRRQSSPPRCREGAGVVELSLEAIFHPKFENEHQTDRSTRRAMLRAVEEACRRGGDGDVTSGGNDGDYCRRRNDVYVEATLKHSGCLLLWNGSTYYSKNSTDNNVTVVGEAVLRQHFARAWWSGEAVGRSCEDGDDDPWEGMYRKCAGEVRARNLSLSFELVTSVLGHHGQIPRRDYLVLTAVADLGGGGGHAAEGRRERFYTSEEMVRFAQRWRLPHNDLWTFSTPESVGRLFKLYDETRETGMAGDTVERLTDVADFHIQSICPHVEFQGDLLEGIVVRLVVGGGGCEKDDDDEWSSELQNLASASRDIVENVVPPSRPPIFELCAASAEKMDTGDDAAAASTNPPPPLLLRTDVRGLFRDSGGGSVGSQGARSAEGRGADAAVGALRDLLRPVPGGTAGGERRDVGRASDPGAAIGSLTPAKSCDLPGLVSKLLLLRRWRGGGQPSPSGSTGGLVAGEGGGEADDDGAMIRLADDLRTARIAALLEAVGELKLPVGFKMYCRRRLDPEGECADAGADAAETETLESEWVCIVHVRSDSAFRRYHAATSSSSSPDGGDAVMPLYRGFSIRIRVGRDEEAGVCGEVHPPPLPPRDDSSGQSEGTSGHPNHRGAQPPSSPSPSSPSLMLKMKFLPYMVRTFICRNGMSILERDGPDGFDAFATNMLENKWGVSQVASELWEPYLSAWGRYAFPLLSGKNAHLGGVSSLLANAECGGNSDMVDDATKTDHEAALPPLTSDTYLYHLARFDELFHEGRLAARPCRGDAASASTAPSFRGLVVVVGVDKEQACRAAAVLSRTLGCGSGPLDGLGIINANSVAMATRPLGGGIVCGCGVVEDGGRGMRALRSLPEKYRDAAFVVRLVHSDEEIDLYVRRGDDGNMNCEKKITNQKKKIAGMSRPWSSLKVKATVEVPARKLFWGENDSSVAGSVGNMQPGNSATGGLTMEMSSLVDRLRGLSEALPRPDTRPGLLVFFPTIPGSGKSTLCSVLECFTSSATSDVESSDTVCGSGGNSNKVNNSGHVNGDPQSVMSEASSPPRQRPIIVRAGDATTEKFWPMVRREKVDQTFTIYVADKNAPPSVWDTIRNIADVSKSFAVAAIPYGAAVLSTTTVAGHASSCDRKIESGIECLELATPSHIYPFSLAYLAACMSRVLARPSNSHCGRLDSSVKDACMIVVKFFSLYRGVSSECFVETLSKQKELVIKVPFFREEKLVRLPLDLEEALLDALRLQYDMDKSNSDTIKELEDAPSSRALQMEVRLRSSLSTHRELLDSLTIEKEKSQEAFLSQLLQLRLELDDALKEQHISTEKGARSGIKLVSVDVEVNDVHHCLEAEAANSLVLAAFLERNGGRVSPAKALNHCVGDKPEQSHFIEQTHVTMAHFSKTSEQKMQSEFGAFVGQAVDVTVASFIFSENVAALSVSSITPSNGATVQLPSCRNACPHITVWCGDGASPHQANNLPAQVLDGSAQEVAFDEVHILRGSLSFWKHNST